MKIVNTNLRQGRPSAVSSTADMQSSSCLKDSLNVRDKYPEVPKCVSRQGDWEDRDNTSSAIPIYRSMNPEDPFSPSTRSPLDKACQASDSPSILISSRPFSPSIFHQDFEMTYKGTFSGGAMFDQTTKCWSAYHAITQIDDGRSPSAVVQAWKETDLLPIYPARRVRLPDNTCKDNTLPLLEQRKVSKSIYQSLVLVISIC